MKKKKEDLGSVGGVVVEGDINSKILRKEALAGREVRLGR